MLIVTNRIAKSKMFRKCHGFSMFLPTSGPDWQNASIHFVGWCTPHLLVNEAHTHSNETERRHNCLLDKRSAKPTLNHTYQTKHGRKRANKTNFLLTSHKQGAFARCAVAVPSGRQLTVFCSNPLTAAVKMPALEKEPKKNDSSPSLGLCAISLRISFVRTSRFAVPSVCLH